MDINKKNRSDLKSYFVKNSIPTESNFAELIDGMLNQKDDGIVKLSGDPLSIESAGDLAGLQKVINFYAKFQDANPSWSLQLNPRTDPNTPSTAKAGFCVADGSGAARLFIDRNTGNIGVGVVTPNGKLDVAGQVRIGLDEGGSGLRSISFARDSGDEGNSGKITYRGGFSGDSLNIVGAGASGTARKIKLWDNVSVVGALTPSAGNSENNGIMFPKDPGAGGGDSAWLRYYPRAGESCTLEIGTSNDADDHIALMPSGGVGIGTNAPGAKLDILANTTTWGGWYEAIRLSQSAHSAITHPGGGLLFGLHGNRRFSFTDTTEGQHIMILNANPAGGGQVSIGAGDSPIAKLDIAQAARSGTHPTAIKGLYITGEFGDADGVEFRHSNATQGIGFGYNTIYAAGSNADQHLQLKPKGTGVMRVLGAANISNGSDYANANKFMSSGSLTIGGINANYGGGAGWTANTAGLLLETLDNTEIAVHDSGTRVTSLMYFQGDVVNKITIGRDMGWGVTPVTIANNLTVNGAITPSAGNADTKGIMFPRDPGGGGGDAAWLRYYARAGESMTLELGTSNDVDDHIALMPSGNVGIGLNNPLYSLDVSAARCIKLGLEGSGGGQLILANNPNDNKIYLEAFSKDGTGSAAELLLTGKYGANVPKLSLLADNTSVSGNLIVKGSILEQNPLIDTNYAIELCGSAFESTEGNYTFLKVNNAAMDMTTLRGLNTVILNPNGSYKNKANHDVYGNAAAWNTWADWINSNAAFGDIVAVATYDATNNAPRSGSADVLLSSILAEKAYTAVAGTNNRTPYALVFMKGGVAVEAASTYKGTNAHLNATSCTLPINRDQWRNAVLINNWVRWDNTYNPAQYFKDSKGLVSLRGLVKSGAAGTVIFTLPEGYRPNYRQLQVVCASDAVGRVDILSNGQVTHVSGPTGWVSLDSISFSTKA